MIFLDGYNVIYSWPELNKARQFSFEAARSKLIHMIQNYAAFKDEKIYIVFDAHLVIGSIEKKEKNGNIFVVFTKEGETADSYIEKWVNVHGKVKNICVVTSDSLEQQVIFGRGATRMSSKEFYYEVKHVNDDIKVAICTQKENKQTKIEDSINKDVLEKLEKIRKNS